MRETPSGPGRRFACPATRKLGAVSRSLMHVARKRAAFSGDMHQK